MVPLSTVLTHASSSATENLREREVYTLYISNLINCTKMFIFCAKMFFYFTNNFIYYRRNFINVDVRFGG